MRFARAVLPVVLAALWACGDDIEAPSNLGPSASFTAQCATLSCTFTNTSADTDGTIEEYGWDFGDGSEPLTTSDAAHTYAAPGGRYTVTLAVTDDDGATATVSRELDVSEGNLAPTAGFTASCFELTCTFADESFDGNTNGSVVSYAWDFGDGQTGTDSNPVHAYAAPGTYTVSLTVTDDMAMAGSTSREVTVTAPAGAGAWTSLAPMPEARSGSAAAGHDGIVYVAGGIAVQGSSWVARPEILAYDVRTNQWRTAGRLAHPVAEAGVAALGDRIYVVGGRVEESSQPTTALQIFDPETGRVEAGPSLPDPKAGMAVTVLDGRLHVIGGTDETGAGWSLSHHVFDPSTESWSTRKTAPIGGAGVVAATLAGNIYLVGHGSGHIYVYEPSTDSWTTRQAPLELAFPAVAAVGGKLYVVGGGEYGSEINWIPREEVNRFDPLTGFWDQVDPMPTPRSSLTAAVVNGSLFVISGWMGTGLEQRHSSINERYTIE